MTVDLNTLDIVLLMLVGYGVFSGLLFVFRLACSALESFIKKRYVTRYPLLPSDCCSRCSRYSSCTASTDCVFISRPDYWDKVYQFRVR